MRVGLRLSGKAIGVEPKPGADPNNNDLFPVYADRDNVNEWEDVELTKQPDFWDARFLASSRQLTITPEGKLESRKQGAIGGWEQLQVLSLTDGTFRLFRPGVTTSLTIQGFVTLPALSKLHRDGLELRTEGGLRHTIKGSTELLLGWRFDQGGAESILEVLEERRKLGFNNLRVLWQKDVNNTGHSPWQMPEGKLVPFLELLTSYGFYTQGTILADCQVVSPSTQAQQERVNRVRSATTGVPSLIEQLGNEYDKNGHNPGNFASPGDRLAANSSSTENGKDAPYWDFFCFSGQRSPLNHAIREYGPVEFMYGDGKGWGGLPALCDEGMKPGLNEGGPREWERAGAQARSGIGGRFHTEAGTIGNSRLFNGIERDCATAFLQGIGV